MEKVIWSQVASKTGVRADFFTLKIEVILSYETSVLIRTARRYNTEVDVIRAYRCENLRSYISVRSRCINL
jgi:hypothetical protein